MSENKKEFHTADGEKKKDFRRHRRPGKHRPKNKPDPKTPSEATLETELIEEEDVLAEESVDIINGEAGETVYEEVFTDNDTAEQEPVLCPTEEAEISPESTEVIGVRFRSSGKIYYFDNCGITYPVGCHAIVDTARGMEYGEVAMTNRMVPTSELVLPLRQALRIATPDDDRHYIENKQKEAEAADVWNKKILQHKLEMKLIDIECTFDNSKILFYFTAEGRVDFRDLVKDLASVFRCRIELRQMGIRDEAKILGGLGVCGRPFCCHSFLPDFVQVSIKMAKEQNLSLNSAKISGACGRLMCCLRYEYDTYLEEAKLTPKVDSLVKTPDGVGTVVEAKPLLGLVKVQLANTPDAAPIVYSRDLLKPHKPGDPIEEPVIPSAKKDLPCKEEPSVKAQESGKKPDNKGARRQNQNQNQNKRANENQDKKPEVEPKKQEKNQRTEKTVKQDKSQENNSEPQKTERKYTIHRASDSKEEGEQATKKKDGYRHHRRNHPAKKKPGEQA